MLTKESIEHSFQEGVKWASNYTELPHPQKIEIARNCEARALKIHKRGIYDDTSCLTSANRLGACYEIARQEGIKAGLISSKYELNALLYKSGVLATESGRRTAAATNAELANEWKCLHRDSGDGEFLTCAGISYENAALFLLEGRQVKREDLDIAYSHLESAERIKKSQSDKSGLAFTLINYSIYWRKFYRLHRDPQGLNLALKSINRAITIFSKIDDKPLKEAIPLPKSVSNAVFEIVDDLFTYHQNKEAGKHIPEGIRSTLSDEINSLSDLELFYSIRSNPECFNVDPELFSMKAEGIHREILQELPAWNKIVAPINSALEVCSKMGVAMSEVTPRVSFDLSRLKTLYRQDLPTDSPLIDQVNFLKELYSGGRRDIAMQEWIQTLRSDIWRSSSEYRSFLALIAPEVKEDNIDRFIVDISADGHRSKGDRSADFLIADLLRNDLKDIAEEIIRHVYKIWIRKAQGQPFFILLHDPFDSAGIFFSDGIIDYEIFQGLGGRMLTSSFYQWSKSGKSGFITDQANGKPRANYLGSAENALSQLQPVASWIKSKRDSRNKKPILIGKCGYFRFLPINAVKVDDGHRLGTEFSIINLAHSTREAAPLNIAEPDISAFGCGNVYGLDPLEVDEECQHIESLFGENGSYTPNATSFEITSAMQIPQIIHFSGHGYVPSIGRPPVLATNSGALNFYIDLPEPNYKTPLMSLGCCKGISSTSTLTPGLEDILISRGVSCVIGAHWDVLDSIARNYTMNFYSALSTELKEEALTTEIIAKSHKIAIDSLTSTTRGVQELDIYSFSMFI